MAADSAKGLIEQLHTFGSDLEKKALAVGTKVQRRVGGGGGEELNRGNMEPEEAMHFVHKALGALQQLCTATAQNLKTVVTELEKDVTALATEVENGKPNPEQEKILRKAKDEVKRRRQEADEATTKVNELQNRVKELEESSKDIEQAKRQAVEAAEGKHQDVLKQLQAAHEEVLREAQAKADATMEAGRQEAQKAVEEAQALAAERQAAIEAQREEHAEALQKATVAEAARDAAEAVLDGLRVELSNTQEALATAEAGRVSAEDTARVASRDRLEAVALHRRVQHEARSAAAMLERARRDANEAKETADQRVREANARVEDVRLELLALQGRLMDDHLREMVRRQQEEITDLRSLHIESTKRITALVSEQQRDRKPLDSSAVVADTCSAMAACDAADAAAREAQLLEQLDAAQREKAELETRHMEERLTWEQRLHRMDAKARGDLESLHHIRQEPNPPALDGTCSGAPPLLMNVACQADDTVRPALEAELNEVRHSLQMATEEVRLVKEEGYASLLEMNVKFTDEIRGHVATIEALERQLQATQLQLPRKGSGTSLLAASSNGGNGSPSPEGTVSRLQVPSVVGGGADCQAHGTAAEGRAAYEAERRELQVAAQALDQWKRGVERENMELRLDCDVQRAKVRSLRKELDRLRDEYETKLRRKDELFEGQTKSMVDHRNLVRETLTPRSLGATLSNTQLQLSPSMMDLQPGPSGGGGGSVFPADLVRQPSAIAPTPTASVGHPSQYHLAPPSPTSGAGGVAAASALVGALKGSTRMHRLEVIDDELHKLHVANLELNRTADDGKARLTAELGRCCAALRTAEESASRTGASAAAKAEAETTLPPLRHEKEEVEAMLQLHYDEMAMRRKKLVQESSALLKERSGLLEQASDSGPSLSASVQYHP